MTITMRHPCLEGLNSGLQIYIYIYVYNFKKKIFMIKIYYKTGWN